MWRLVNRGSLLVTDVDTVDAMAVLDANEALDVHLDVESAIRPTPAPQG